MTHGLKLRQQLCWDDLQAKRLKQVATMLFQVHHSLSPEYSCLSSARNQLVTV